MKEIIYSKYDRVPLVNGENYNAFIVCAPGSGKTCSYIKVNLNQMFGSYVVIDTKGKLYYEFHKKLEKNGYNVMLIDIENPKNSLHYNPVSFLKNESDVRDLSACISNRVRQTTNSREVY